MLILKGQLISKWIFGILNFPKIVRISAQKSKKCSNQTNKEISLCQIIIIIIRSNL